MEKQRTCCDVELIDCAARFADKEILPKLRRLATCHAMAEHVRVGSDLSETGAYLKEAQSLETEILRAVALEIRRVKQEAHTGR